MATRLLTDSEIDLALDEAIAPWPLPEWRSKLIAGELVHVAVPNHPESSLFPFSLHMVYLGMRGNDTLRRVEG